MVERIFQIKEIECDKMFDKSECFTMVHDGFTLPVFFSCLAIAVHRFFRTVNVYSLYFPVIMLLLMMFGFLFVVTATSVFMFSCARDRAFSTNL